jgi:cytochrome P450
MDRPIDLMAPEVRANPYPIYASLRRTGPCQVAPGGMWAISRHVDVITVLRDPRRFSSAGLAMSFQPPWLGRSPIVDSLVMKDPPDHTRLRAVIAHAFAPPALACLEPRIRAMADELATSALERQDIDFVAELSSLLPVRVLGMLFGLNESHTARLQRWADDLLAIPAGQPTPERREQIRASLEEMERCFEELLAARQAAPGEDLISDLVRAEQTGHIDRHESMSFLFALIPAGVETTVHLLGNTMVVLARHPQVCAQVLADPALIPALIEEVLRLEPPGHSSLRLAIEDTALAGVRIPRHAVLVVLLAAALRDEERFHHADQPLLDRDRTSHLPFGHGVHYCLGHLLARLEARLALEALFSRIRGFHLRELEVQWTQSLIARGPVSLPVRLEPRSNPWPAASRHAHR